MPLQGTRSLTVRAEAADSTLVPEATLWWETGDTSIATYDPGRGEITGRGVGTTTITLRARGFDPVSWVIEVVPGGIALDRSRVAMTVGSRTRLEANLVDAAGAVLAPAGQLEWSSDRPSVAVVGNDGVVEATGFGRARLTATTAWGRSDSADVFVVGDLVFSANRGGAHFGIYQLSRHDPAVILPILADSFQNVQPALSPDRTTIVFSSNREGDFDLYAMDPDGQNIRKLTSQAGSDGDPAWTPDGSRILFTGTRAGGSQVFSMQADGSGLRALTTLGGSVPAVAPDGRTVAFVSARDGNDEIYRMDLDGSNQVNLSATREKEGSPQFFANGDLAYAAEQRRGGWQVVRTAPGDTARAVLATSEQAITSLALSPEGDLLAVVAGRITDRGRGRAEFVFSLVQLPGGTPLVIPTMANEQVAF
jgi:dipeptidyl aminopeptidase/acylaminoacyl peptidase